MFVLKTPLLCRESEKINNRNLPGTISDYSKVAGYKVNIQNTKQKSISFLYTSNEQVGFEIKNTLAFILVPPKIPRIGNSMFKNNKEN